MSKHVLASLYAFLEQMMMDKDVNGPIRPRDQANVTAIKILIDKSSADEIEGRYDDAARALKDAANIMGSVWGLADRAIPVLVARAVYSIYSAGLHAPRGSVRRDALSGFNVVVQEVIQKTQCSEGLVDAFEVAQLFYDFGRAVDSKYDNPDIVQEIKKHSAAIKACIEHDEEACSHVMSLIDGVMASI